MPRYMGDKKVYQTYYRDPVSRKFVPIAGVTVQLEQNLTYSFPGYEFEPQLSGGIPIIKWLGNRFRAPFGTPGEN
tara:strand:- start:386 stop:610 length:225 start_codon:yes stop_codon:yes gene_type:complete